MDPSITSKEIRQADLPVVSHSYEIKENADEFLCCSWCACSPGGRVLIKCDITGPNLRLEFEKYYNVLHLVVYVGTLISPLSGARRQKYHSSTKSAEGEG